MLLTSQPSAVEHPAMISGYPQHLSNRVLLLVATTSLCVAGSMLFVLLTTTAVASLLLFKVDHDRACLHLLLSFGFVLQL